MKRRAKVLTLVAILVVHAVLFTALAQIKTEMGTQPISLVGGRCTGVTMLMVSTYTGHAGYCPCPSAVLSGVAAMTWQLAVIISPMVTMRKLLTKCAHSRQYAYGLQPRWYVNAVNVLLPVELHARWYVHGLNVLLPSKLHPR